MPFTVSADSTTVSRYVDGRIWYCVAMSIFRISRPDDGQVVDVDSLDGVEATIASGKPGRYHVDEFSRDQLPSGHTSRRWGTGIKRDDGTIAIEPDPWPDRRSVDSDVVPTRIRELRLRGRTQ
jgi:hypothetical protein